MRLESTARPSNAAASAKPKLGESILGVDYGRARIGVAVASDEARLAQPLGTLVRKNRDADMRRLREIVREHGVRRIVVGLPLRLDGTRGEMAEEAARFAERLRKQIGVIVEMVDERLTSWEAEQMIGRRQIGHRDTESTGNRKKKNRKGNEKSSMDAIAAAVILREYLEREQASKEQS